MGTWMIYTFDDLTAYWSALNALAAYFSNTSTINSAAFLGGLIGLTFILYGFATYSTDISRTMQMAATWGGLVFFCFAPVNVQIQNVYTAQYSAVSNVPAVVAIPASLFTSIGWSMTQSMDTAFQSTNGSYLTVSQNGLIQPLQIYLSLMDRGYAQAQDPYLYRTINTIITDCARGGTITRGVTPNVETVDNTVNIVQYLINNLRQTGLTVWYDQSNPSGVTISCADAAAKLDPAMSAFLASSKPANMIAIATGSSTSVGGSKYTIINFYNTADTLGTAISNYQQSSAQLANSMLLSRTVDYSLSCLQQNAQISSTSNTSCTNAGLISGVTIQQMQNEMVVTGNTWNKVLYTSIGVMQYLFFSLAPIVLIIILIWPMHAGKLFTGYMMFGLWISSWLLFSAPMSYYIQTQVVGALNATMAPFKGLAIANSDVFRDAMMQKLAFASSMIASTPLIALAMLSGSFFSLNSLASKMDGQSHAKADDVTPRNFSNAPLQQASPQTQFNTKSGVGVATNAADMMINTSHAVSTGISSTDAASIGKVKSDGKSITWTNAQGHVSETTVGEAKKFSDAMRSTVDSAFQASGLVNAEILKNATSLDRATRQVRDSNGMLSPEHARQSVEASLTKIAMENLQSQDQNFMLKMAGKSGDNDASRSQNQSDAQAAYKKETQKLLDELDNNPTKLKLLGSTAGAFAVATGVDFAKDLIPINRAKALSNTAGSTSPQAISKSATLASSVASSIVGEFSPSTRSSLNRSVGVDMGLTVGDTEKLSTAVTLLNAASQQKGTSWNELQSFQTTGSNMASRTVTTSQNLVSVAREYEMRPDRAQLDAQKALGLGSERLKYLSDKYGISSNDQNVQLATMYAAHTGVADFTAAVSNGMPANANQNIVTEVKDQVNNDVRMPSGAGAGPRTSLQLTPKQQGFIEGVTDEGTKQEFNITAGDVVDTLDYSTRVGKEKIVQGFDMAVDYGKDLIGSSGTHTNKSPYVNSTTVQPAQDGSKVPVDKLPTNKSKN